MYVIELVPKSVTSSSLVVRVTTNPWHECHPSDYKAQPPTYPRAMPNNGCNMQQNDAKTTKCDTILLLSHAIRPTFVELTEKRLMDVLSAAKCMVMVKFYWHFPGVRGLGQHIGKCGSGRDTFLAIAQMALPQQRNFFCYSFILFEEFWGFVSVPSYFLFNV